jgi:LPXTG-motif cell wall-anchored protein
MKRITTAGQIAATRAIPLTALALTALALLLATVFPAFAQAQEGPTTVTATGVLVGPVGDNDPDPTPEFRLTDEATGRSLNLVSGFVNLQDFAGQRRVVIEGMRVPRIDPNAFNVTSIRSADEPPQPPPVDECPVLSPTPELCDGSSGGGSGTGGTEGGASSGGAGVAKVLPKTGGDVLPVAGAVGVLLVGGGLLVRRIFR